MAVYRVTSQDFEPLTETSFEAERLYERNHIQSRLRERPEVLEDGLFILAEEYGDWEESNRRIDLLAIDSQGRLTVIELKRSDSDSMMDLQAIRYAALVANMTLEQALDAHRNYPRNQGREEGEADNLVRARLTGENGDIRFDSGKPRIILVSSSFSKELTTSVLWLNQTGMDITCVKLQPYKTADSLFLESSRVIPIPEAEEYQVRLRNQEVAQQQRQAASGVETSTGSDKFRKSLETAEPHQKPRLAKLLDLAVSLETEGLAELSTNSGSSNTVLRVRLPGSVRGFFNVVKTKPGWGYLQFGSALLFDSDAPRSKKRLEQVLDRTITSLSTVWETRDGFIDALGDAYREANGYPVSNAGPEHGPGPETTEDSEEPEQTQE